MYYLNGMGIWMVWIIIGGFVLIINSAFTSWLAKQKGYSSFNWFFLALFFGFIPFLAIGFAPNLYQKNQVKTKEKIKIEQEESLQIQEDILTDDEAWICSKCGKLNSSKSITCVKCKNIKV